MIRVLLADHRLLLHIGLQTVLHSVADIFLSEEIGYFANTPHLCRKQGINVLLITANLPGLQIDGFLTEMSVTAPHTQVLLLLESSEVIPSALHKLLRRGG